MVDGVASQRRAAAFSIEELSRGSTEAVRLGESRRTSQVDQWIEGHGEPHGELNFPSPWVSGVREVRRKVADRLDRVQWQQCPQQPAPCTAVLQVWRY